MSRSAREMTVSRCQKRWNSAMSQHGHMGAHIVERDQRLLTRSATRKTSPAAERCTHGLNSMSSAFYGLAKAAIYDLIDWQC